ncbi:Phage portal protein, SPP1 Gp6-like [Sinosporangium album]|uniref:Phage portal protein, SPP1 Gp6-like n=1 Tax=Sinosporangium album TaxID=504805 RepID=A0A1G8KBK9_9ACTN|nr:phage portal protein [Sinosporangium album]SDI40825.1 Phage portal protein, SPP1 Gp6-like [Sinosporangium album]
MNIDLSQPDDAILRTLIRRIQKRQRRLDELDAYYEGDLRLQALGLALPPELAALQTVVNWPGMYVDALEERLDVEGFRLGGSARTDDRMWDWWQANDLDEESGSAHLESFIASKAFVCVGTPDDAGGDAAPVITVESPRYMATATDPRSRTVEAAARLYGDVDEDGRRRKPTHATLYLNNRTVHYRRRDGWEVDYIDDHKLGLNLVVPMPNRPRAQYRDGYTEMRDIMGLTDAACRTLTNLQGAQELLAVPQRYVLGATEEDFRDQDGKVLTAWEAYLGRFLTLGNHEAKAGQFSAADLRNFTTVLEWYARAGASVTGLPAHYFGLTSENPASADAIRAGEARLIKKAERAARTRSGPWEQVMRRGLAVTGRDPNEAIRLETVWRDAATPTFAAKADAVVKLHAAGILPLEAAWEQMGWGPEYRRRLRRLNSDDPAVRYLEANADKTAPGAGNPDPKDPDNEGEGE